MKKRNRTARIVLLAIIGVIIALFMVQTVNARKMKLSPDDILALNVTVYDENKTRKEYSYDQANGYIEIKKDDLDTFAETLSSLEYRAFDIKSGFDFINVDYPCQEVMVYRRRNGSGTDLMHLFILPSGLVYQELTKPNKSNNSLMLKYRGGEDIYKLFSK